MPLNEDDDLRLIPRVFLWGLALVAVTIMIVGVWYAWYPTQLDMERNARTHSQTYVQARLTEIQSTLAQCRTIDSQLASEGASPTLREALEAEKATLNDMIVRALSEIPPDAHPANTSACR